MSDGKYTSLEEAKDEKGLKKFIKQHPSTGNKEKFDGLLERMAKSQKPKKK
jgi:hypothetical protein